MESPPAARRQRVHVTDRDRLPHIEPRLALLRVLHRQTGVEQKHRRHRQVAADGRSGCRDLGSQPIHIRQNDGKTDQRRDCRPQSASQHRPAIGQRLHRQLFLLPSSHQPEVRSERRRDDNEQRQQLARVEVTYNLALWNVKKATGELLQTEQVSWNRACVEGLPTLVVDKYGKPVEYQRDGLHEATPYQPQPVQERPLPPEPMDDQPSGPTLTPTGGRVEPKASRWQSTKNKLLRRE